jgi:hypothetical protein
MKHVFGNLLLLKQPSPYWTTVGLMMNAKSKYDESSLAKPLTIPSRDDLPWRNHTDKLVYHLLKDSGPQTRSDLVARTALPRTTIFDALTRLTIRGLIVRYSESRLSRGRPRVFYEAVI